MKILLDENIPHGFRGLLIGHDVFTVQWLGWGSIKNGELLKKANGQFDLVITVDRGIKYQTNFSDKEISLITIVSPSNRLYDLKPFASIILIKIKMLKSGAVVNLDKKDLW
jgi:hypothetical protein